MDFEIFKQKHLNVLNWIYKKNIESLGLKILKKSILYTI